MVHILDIYSENWSVIIFFTILLKRSFFVYEKQYFDFLNNSSHIYMQLM